MKPSFNDTTALLCWLNQTIERVVILNMKWLCFFLFLFGFVNARCGCCSAVCLRFQVIQIKQVDCKMNTKKTFFKKTFRDIFGQLHTQECKAPKK